MNNSVFPLALATGLGKQHDVLYPWLLHLAPTDRAPFQQQQPKGDVVIDPKAEDIADYNIDAILDSHTNKQQLDPVTKRPSSFKTTCAKRITY